MSCTDGLGESTDAMVILVAGALEVLIADGFRAVPGLIARAGAGVDELEADDGVGGPGGEEAAVTDVEIEMPLDRGAIVAPEEVD